ncbi:MAG: hypothetical protein AVDCRST_MAG54-241, partial [uncultured Actinomycetospora sp.]
WRAGTHPDAPHHPGHRSSAVGDGSSCRPPQVRTGVSSST